MPSQRLVDTKFVLWKLTSRLKDQPTGLVKRKDLGLPVKQTHLTPDVVGSGFGSHVQEGSFETSETGITAFGVAAKDTTVVGRPLSLHLTVIPGFWYISWDATQSHKNDERAHGSAGRRRV